MDRTTHMSRGVVRSDLSRTRAKTPFTGGAKKLRIQSAQAVNKLTALQFGTVWVKMMDSSSHLVIRNAVTKKSNNGTL